MDVAQVLRQAEIALNPRWALPATSVALPLPTGLVERIRVDGRTVPVQSRGGDAPLPRILFAEDDDDLRSVMQVILQSSGFEVIACSDGEKAAKTFGLDMRFDLLLTDLEMPGMSGADLASDLTRSRSSLPVVIVSGAALPPSRREDFANHGWVFLSKPFEIHDLLAHISSVLASAKALSKDVVASASQGSSIRKEVAEAGVVPVTPSTKSEGVDGKSKRRILLIGDDPVLLNTRARVLQLAGYETESVNSCSCLDDTALNTFSLVLICRSISTVRALAVEATIHAVRARLPILRLARPGEEYSATSASMGSDVTSPVSLLAEVEKLVA